MNLYREQGVVLRTYKLGEADRIVVLLTQGSGKVRAVAKGVRRPRSRFGGRLEPFSHIDCTLYRGRNLDIVTQAELVRPLPALRGNYDRLCAGAAMLEAVDQVAQEREPAVRVFLLLVRGLAALEQAPPDPSVVLDGFLLKLLTLEGYQPTVADCAACGAPGPHRRFSATRGGSVCERCRAGESPLDAGTLPLLAALLTGELGQPGGAGATGTGDPGASRREVGRLVQSYAEHHLERRLRAMALVAR